MPNLEAYPMTYSNSKSQPEVLESGMIIEQLLEEYYPYIRRLALSILDDPHEVEDVAQETFIAAHRSLPSLLGDSVPKTWLTSIAVNSSRGGCGNASYTMCWSQPFRRYTCSEMHPPHLSWRSPPNFSSHLAF